VNEQLQAYIAQCRAQGFDDGVIRQQLLAAGWDISLVQGALPEQIAPSVTPSTELSAEQQTDTPQQATVSRRNIPWQRVGLIGAMGIGAFLLVMGVLVSVAEAGFMPGFSQLYRKTNLPLIWGGTVADPAIALVQSGSAFTGATAWGIDMRTTLTMEEVGGSQGAVLTDIPYLRELASEDEPTDTSVPVALALVESDELIALPFTVSMSGHIYGNAAGSVAAGVSLDVASLVQSQPGLEDYLNKDLGEATVDMRMIENGGSFDTFLMTNILPRFELGDASRWFRSTAIDLFAEGTQDTTPEDIYSQAQIDSFIALFRAAMEDKGVQRLDGKPVSVHAMTLTPAVLQGYATDSQYATIQPELRELYEQMSASGIQSFAVQYFADAKGGAFHKLVTTIDSIADGYATELMVEAVAANSTVVAEGLSKPADSAVMELPLEEYAGEVFVASVGGDGGLVSTGLLTENSYSLISEMVLASLDSLDSLSEEYDLLSDEEPEVVDEFDETSLYDDWLLYDDSGESN
jgi:hypothetical protein